MSPLGYYINNLLTLGIRKCVYDRIVYIVKKGINILSKKGFLRGGGAQCCQGGKKNFFNADARKMCSPKKQMISYAPEQCICLFLIMVKDLLT